MIKIIKEILKKRKEKEIIKMIHNNEDIYGILKEIDNLNERLIQKNKKLIQRI